MGRNSSCQLFISDSVQAKAGFNVETFRNQKKLLIPGRKSIHQINREQDLTSNPSVDEETRGGLIASCSLKKSKLEPVLTQHVENSHEPSSIVREAQLNSTSTINNLVKHEKLQVSDYGSFQNGEVGSAVLLGDEMIAQRKTEMLSQRNKVVLSSPSPCGVEERKGYAFLIQVKEKLTDAEYKEFLGFMKALKSKTMEIDQVLQCIVRLFSFPDRFPLLERFKDYIPVKYHSLYEQYLKRSDNAVDV